MTNSFTPSKDPKVQQHLLDTMMFHEVQFNILIAVRDLVFGSHSDIWEKMMYGGIMFSVGEAKQCGVYVSKNHVSLEFSKGYLLTDPNQILEGVGHTRRHIKLKTVEDIESKQVVSFLAQLSTL